MKINITMKTPDAVDNAILSAIREKFPLGSEEDDTTSQEYFDANSEEELEVDRFHENCKRILNKFFKYGEYVTIEVDLETETARVIPNKG